MGPSVPASHPTKTSPSTPIPRASVLLLLIFTLLGEPLHGAGIWDGEAGDGLYFTPLNWDSNEIPGFSVVPTFPASAPNKEINLGSNWIAHERLVMLGGFRLFNGRVGVAGGGGNSTIESQGDNTLDADFGTFEWGNDLKLVQAAGGTLTVNGSSSFWVKGVILRGAGTIRINGTIAPLPGFAFYKEGTGVARVETTGRIHGASAGRFVTAGTLILNGLSNNAGTWTVNGGKLGGSGTLQSALSVGETLGSSLAPGDPLADNGIGTFTVHGPVTFGNNAVLEVEVGNPGTSDRLVVTGSLAIGVRTGLWVKTLPGSLPSGTYTILTHSGSRSGEFVLLDGPPGSRLDHSVPGEVRLIVEAPPAPENIVFPSGAEIIDVTQPPYGAIPDDGLDDTAAIQAALNAFPNGRRIIYLPNGTYHVSNTLNWPAGIPGWTDYKHTILQGQSRDGVILRLIDNAPLFQNPASRKPVLYTGPAPAQRFGIMIRNLTVHTGSGNPGASGIQLNANNFGGMTKVKIMSGDGQGVTGLDFHFTAEIGPLLVQDLEVQGFNHGIRTADAINGIVLERVTLRGQNVAGIENSGQVFSIRGLKSVNSVPAVIAGTNPFGGLDTGGVCTLLDAILIGLPGAEAHSAITTSAFFYGRNIISTGYARVLTRPTLSGNINLPQSTLDEYQSRSVLSAFPSPSRSLHLPVEDPPEIPLDPPADWADVRHYGAIGNGSFDNTAAFQAAIDSGKPTVYVPPVGFYLIQGDVILRGNVRRFTGTHANVAGQGRLIVSDGIAPAVVIERSGYPQIVHQSARTLIVRHVEAAGITSTSPGKLFLEDVVTERVNLQNPRLRAWARQLNTENGTSTNVTNNGATFWVFGYKTERGQVKIETLDGGFTELFGAHIYSTTGPKTTPAFVVHDASFSIAGMGESNFEGTNYTEWVAETRGSTTQSLLHTSLPFRTSANGRALTLFTGFDGAPKRPLDLAAHATSPTTVALSWNDQSWDESEFRIERSSDGTTWTTIATSTSPLHSDNTVSPGTTWFYRVRAANPTAASAPTPAVSVTTPTWFQSWALSNGLDGSPGKEAGFQADPDGDGLVNGLEWILSGHPLVPNPAIAPQIASDATTFIMTFTRSDASEVGTVLVAQWSTNLTTWNDVPVGASSSGPDANGITVEIAENGANPDLVTVRVPNANAASGRLFLRLKATPL